MVLVRSKFGDYLKKIPIKGERDPYRFATIGNLFMVMDQIFRNCSKGVTCVIVYLVTTYKLVKYFPQVPQSIGEMLVTVGSLAERLVQCAVFL